MAGETATAADNTHPTGMHSCCYYEITDFYALKSMYVRTSNILDSGAAGKKGSIHSHAGATQHEHFSQKLGGVKKH